MKLSFLTICILFVYSGCHQKKVENDNSQVPPMHETTKLPEVSLLGIFHFAGTSDFSSVEFEPLSSEKRQQEILELVERLKKYEPTKVLVEYPYEERFHLDSIFQLYLKDGYPLTLNEIDQVGFRLAKAMNHRHIYAIDHHLSLPFEALSEFANEHQSEQFQAMLKGIKEQDSIESDYLRDHSITEYLYYRNSKEEDIRNKDQYLNKTLKFGDETHFIGASFTAKWWERNLIMMSHIDKNMEANDRLLVIVGAAHRAVLKDFYETRTDVTYMEIQPYLDP
ncbi:MAG: DUF5694 domain-containing protein [Bacteroidota bacterium]